MWWRFLVFCVLVTLVLFIVLSCIYGRPVVHLFFHRCCGEDIENDQVIYENFGNNFLRERLVAAEENATILSSEDEVEDIIESTTKISFKNIAKAITNNSNVYRDVTKVNVTFLPFEALVRNKSEFTTDTLLGKDAAQVENLTLFSFEIVDKEFKNELKTEGLISTDSMEIENKFSFDDVGKAIDDMKRLFNNHNPLTRDDYDVMNNRNPSTRDHPWFDVTNNYNPTTKDAYDELEADLMTEDDVLDVTTERFKKRN